MHPSNKSQNPLSWPTWLLPSVQKNHNNYIISLANLCRWLAEQAEALGQVGQLIARYNYAMAAYKKLDKIMQEEARDENYSLI